MDYSLFDEEASLINDLKSGHQPSFSIIYKRYYNKLCRYVYSMSNNNGIAEDIVQQTLLDLWEKRDKLVIRSSLNAYLYRCARNKFFDHIKKENRQNSSIEQLRVEAILEVENLDAEIKERRLVAIENIIASLPKKRKEIFILNKFKNYKYREIATLQNISVRTVESQIRKALITIRKEMELMGLNDFLLLLPFFFSY